MSESNGAAGCGCFGCLMEIVGILGLIYLVTHWSAIWATVR